MSITISDLNDKLEYAEKARCAMEPTADACSKILELVPKDKKDDARQLVNQIIIATNQGKSQLRDYESLLRDIMRRTRLDWPPCCVSEPDK